MNHWTEKPNCHSVLNDHIWNGSFQHKFHLCVCYCAEVIVSLNTRYYNLNEKKQAYTLGFTAFSTVI